MDCVCIIRDMKTTTTSVSTPLCLALDTARNMAGNGRGNALRAVHAKMLAAKIEPSHWLWRMLDDAYEA